jgi:hypothetical protein
MRVGYSAPVLARAQTGPSTPWLISPTADLAALVLVTLSSLVPWLLAERLGWSWRAIVVLVGAFKGPHLISTLTRVYFRRDERFRRPFHYWVVPGLLIGYVAACRSVDDLWGPIVLRTTLFYWASWHFVAQSFGILRLYQRKHGVVDGELLRLEKALVFLPALFFVLRRLCTGPWELLGSYLLHPTTPRWLVNAVGALTVGVAIYYLARARRASPSTGRALRMLYLASSAFGFFVPYMLLKQGTTAFAAAALWHAIQYIAIVWLYNRRKFAGHSPSGGALDRGLAWLSQPGRTPLYLASMMVPGFFAYLLVKCVMPFYRFSLESAILAVWTGGTLAHYYLDGVIWKSRRYDLRPVAQD